MTVQGVIDTDAELTDRQKKNEDLGFTHPNLHRRYKQIQPSDSRETAPRDYSLGVYDGIHSYRTTEIHYHDEESTTCEIP